MKWKLFYTKFNFIKLRGVPYCGNCNAKKITFLYLYIFARYFDESLLNTVKNC